MTNVKIVCTQGMLYILRVCSWVKELFLHFFRKFSISNIRKALQSIFIQFQTQALRSFAYRKQIHHISKYINTYHAYYIILKFYKKKKKITLTLKYLS